MSIAPISLVHFSLLCGLLVALYGAFWSPASDPLFMFLIAPVVSFSLQRVRGEQEHRAQWLTDGDLHVVMCGTGTPLPDKNKAAQCIAVMAAGQMYIFDTGAGSSENVALMNLPMQNLSGILFTHYHSDHIADFGEMVLNAWLRGRAGGRLPVYGPPGLDNIVKGYELAYELDRDYRVAHHSEQVLPREASYATPHTVAVCGTDDDFSQCDAAGQRSTVVIDKDGLKITAFLVHHEPAKPAYGYKIEYAGKKVVISGDTKQCDEVLHHARHADLLIHDAINHGIVGMMSDTFAQQDNPRVSRMMNDILDYHASPTQAMQTAAEADVGVLLLVHMVPPSTNSLIQRFGRLGWASLGTESSSWGRGPPPMVGRREGKWSGRWLQAEDGMHFTMKPGDDMKVKENPKLL